MGDISELIKNPNWFPFVETWSPIGAKEMFKNLVESEYGDPGTLPKVRKDFSARDFKFSIPDNYRKPATSILGGSYAILTHDVGLEDYVHMNAISDFYMEDLRISTSRRLFMNLTPLAMWEEDKAGMVEAAKKKYGPSAGVFELRNMIFNMTKESNPFRPSIALAVYSLFNARNILDMSAGWGDRLLGALAWSRRRPGRVLAYDGYDPFEELQLRYRSMILDNADEADVQRFNVHPEPFEKATLGEMIYDLAFTSPPYFNFELYGLTDDKEQSTKNYAGKDEWIEGFLTPMMNKAAHSLRIGGHLAVNIEGTFVYSMLNIAPTIFGKRIRMDYHGIVGYTSDDPKDKIIHPIFVWRRAA